MGGGCEKEVGVAGRTHGQRTCVQMLLSCLQQAGRGVPGEMSIPLGDLLSRRKQMPAVLSPSVQRLVILAGWARTKVTLIVCDTGVINRKASTW